MADITPAKLAHIVFEPKDGSDSSLSPVIFLHGLGGNKESWDDVPQMVADQTKRMCYAIDARNHGDSEYTETFNFDQNTVDILNFLDSLHVSRAILVGVSMGGCTAIGAALAQPERVEKIISVDMHTKKFDQTIADLVAGYINIWRTAVQQLPTDLSLEDGISLALDSLFNKLPLNTLRTFIPPKDKMRGLGKNVIKNPDGTFDVKYNKQALMESFKNPDSVRSECKGTFEGPAQFIYGEISPLNVGKEEANIRKHFPNAELIEFKGATHAIPYECPQQFFQTMMTFLVK